MRKPHASCMKVFLFKRFFWQGEPESDTGAVKRDGADDGSTPQRPCRTVWSGVGSGLAVFTGARVKGWHPRNGERRIERRQLRPYRSAIL